MQISNRATDREQAVDAGHRVDAKHNGSNPVDVLIKFPRRCMRLRGLKRFPRCTQSWKGASRSQRAVERATRLVGPPLILTSLVLVRGLRGLIVTVFSNLPSLRLFGWLRALAMLPALVADLLTLRLMIMSVSRLARRAGAEWGHGDG